jgi:YD repeat-containing protein
MSNYNANDELAMDTYDANGNTTASIGQGYVYDFENHLIQAGGVTYTYDGDGNRVQKVAAAATTQYTVDSHNPTGYAQVLVDWRSDVGAKYYIYGLELLGGDSGSRAGTRQKGRPSTRSHAFR